MTLFEMNAEVERLMNQLCDQETGEINEEIYDALQQLEIDKSEKIDDWCYFLKQKKAELDAAKSILDNAKERYEAMESTYKRLKGRFEILMEGEKFKSSFNTVYYRTNESVVLDEGVDVRDVDDEYLTYQEPLLDKNRIKSALKLGEKIKGVHLQESTSMIIK